MRYKNAAEQPAARNQGEGESPILTGALSHASRGWPVVPLAPRDKKPILRDWPNQASTDEATIRGWFTKWPDMNIGLATGGAAGFFVLDVDGPEGATSLAVLEEDNGVLPETIECRTGSGSRHLYFSMPTQGDVTNKQRFRPGLDIRGTGGQVVAPPSVHPGGGVYAWAKAPDEHALAPAPAWLLSMIAPGKLILDPAGSTQHAPSMRPPEAAKPLPPWARKTAAAIPAQITPPRAPSGTPILERASLYLRECEPAVQGQAGHDKLLWAARAMVVGFELDEGTATALLWSEFNPRCCPPWNFENAAESKDFERKIAEVRRTPGTKPRGWLLDDYGLRGPTDALLAMGGEIAANLLASHVGEAAEIPEETTEETPGASLPEFLRQNGGQPDANDPGQMPDRLLRVPGFMDEFMDYCMKTAPYPNRQLAFAGALSMLSLLTGRKVRDPGDVRTNVYIVSLAASGAGKEHPRKLIKAIAVRAGFADSIGDRFASAPGIEDALMRTPAKLYLTDEMDSLLQSMRVDGDSLYEAIQSMLLSLFGEASSLHIRRDRSGDTQGGSINQPHLVIFGTAIPNHFYSAFSARMLSNGLFSRLMLFDASQERVHNDKSSPIDPPESLIEVARWWWEQAPGGDMAHVNPIPREVPQTTAAKTVLSSLRNEIDREYNGAAKDDDTTRAVLARVAELARKLALLYAVSANHETPLIDGDAARWGAEVATRQAKRMLAMVGRYGASSPFERDCRDIIERLIATKDRKMVRTELMRSMQHLSAKLFDERMRTLMERGEVEITSEPTRGRPAVIYTATKRKKKR